MAKVDYTLAGTLLIAIINADGASSFTLSVTDLKTSLGMVKESVLLGDADVCGAYLDNLDSPYREDFLALSADLDHGDKIPAYVGKAFDVKDPRCDDKVIVKVNSADTVYKASTRAPSVEQIEKWRRNASSIYGSAAHNAANSPLGARHRIHHNHIYFTGNKAKIWLPQFTIDRATPSCKADALHTGLVVSRAVKYAHKEGYASDWLFQEHLKDSEAGLASLRGQGRG